MLVVDTTTYESEDAKTRRGRPRDPERDAAILQATLELLVRDGYDRLTMDHVAAHAGAGKATIYRRWSSKAELVMDALSTIKPALPAIDTGSLDGDLDALIAASCGQRSTFGSQVMGGIASSFSRDPELLAAFQQRFTQPRIARIAQFLELARDRGELDDTVDIEFVSSIVPSLMLQRALMTGRPADRHYAEQVVGQALLPMLGRPARHPETKTP
ncbi:MAG: TetR/AcrR family transcriptional regulator [Thermoleophilia bacterium]|nr:TetR/AcrR family transcriptional regulator [Thermoleophilia bacterium]